MSVRSRCRVRLAVLAGLVAAATGACERAERGAPVQIGQPAPAYGTRSIDGDSVSLAGQRGKVVLFNIWATWCIPCREELPALQRLHERYASQGLSLVGVSVDARGEEENVRDFARRYGITYPIWLDPDERAPGLFLAVGVPATYLIGRDGTLLWRRIGPVRDDDPTLRRALEQALRARTS